MAQNIFDHLNISGYCVVNGGSQIYDPKSKNVIKEVCLSDKIIQKVYTLFHSYGITPSINDGLRDVLYTGGPLRSKVLDIFVADLIPSVAEKIEKDLELVGGIYVHKVHSWKNGYMSLDITGEEATKLHGVSEVLKILNVSKDDVIGVGDSYNDFPLLMACGLKIAMGNAVPELKAIADFIAPTVDDDGIATIIDTFILPSGAP